MTTFWEIYLISSTIKYYCLVRSVYLTFLQGNQCNPLTAQDTNTASFANVLKADPECCKMITLFTSSDAACWEWQIIECLCECFTILVLAQ